MPRLYFFIYSLVVVALLPFAILRLFYKSRKNPDYRKRIKERLSLYSQLTSSHTQPVDIWIHSVSVGEFLAVKPLIEKLLAANHQLLVTTTTPTGSKLVLDHFANQLQHVYLPFDIALFNQRFIKQFQPKVGVFVETEIWPNLVCQLYKKQIPTLLINARLSEKSFHRYQELEKFSQVVFSQFTEIACQNAVSTARFKSLQGNATTLGNIKFDLNPPTDLTEKQQAITTLLNGKHAILFASTHDKEEAILLNNLPKETPQNTVYIIAPRHPERAAGILNLCQTMGFKTGFVSQTTQINDEQVLILDSLGQLLCYYSLAKLAVIGGSFVNHGGHNPLEAALFKTPCVIGKYYFNFQSLIDEMLDKQAILVVDSKQLTNLIAHFDETSHHALGEAAYQYLLTNQGALQRYQDLIENSIANKI